MFGLSGFFKNIQNAFTKEVLLRTEIKNAIKKHTNLEIDIQNIIFKNGTVVLKKQDNSALSLIYIKKQKIIDFLNKEIGLKNIKDIR